MSPRFTEKALRRKEKDQPADCTVDTDSLQHLTHAQKRILLDQVEDPDANRKVTYRDLFSFATRTELALDALGILAAITAGVGQPLMIVVFGVFIDAFVDYGSATNTGEGLMSAQARLLDAVNQGALYLLYIGLASFVATYIHMSVWMYNGEVLSRRIREAYLRAALRQNIGFWDESSPTGEITTRITSDMSTLQRGIAEKVPMTVQYVSQFVAGFVVAFVKDWRLALALSSIVPATLLAGSFIAVLETRFKGRAMASLAKGSSIIEEAFSAIRTVHAFDSRARLAALYDDHNNEALKNGRQSAIAMACTMSTFYFVLYSGYALAFWFGTRLVFQGISTSGDVLACVEAVVVGAISISSIAPYLQAITAAIGAGDKIFHTIWRIPPIDSMSEQGLKPETVAGELLFQNVDFYYPSRPSVKVLDDYSLAIPKGKTTALVGQSGSGKSSVVALLERFYNPTSGSIMLDGTDISTLNVRWLRSQIGTVSQEPTLFAGSVTENVALGLIDSPFEDVAASVKRDLVEKACKLANAHDFVCGLSDGYETNIGERGLLLSGGQKQRIAIARAIVANPPILLLDEATSALDVTSERLVQRALDTATLGRTVISIAHRLSTIRSADQIVVMASGRIAEIGTHQTLLSQKGIYASLVRSQALAEQESSKDTPSSMPKLAEAQSDPRVETVADTQLLDLARMPRASATLVGSGRPPQDSKGSLGVMRLARRFMLENRDSVGYYIVGVIGAATVGMVTPIIAILFGAIVTTFTLPDRNDWIPKNSYLAGCMFAVACTSAVMSLAEYYSFIYASENLSKKLRLKLFKSNLDKDIAYFDDSKNSTGALASSITELPLKVNSAAGVTTAAILQSIITLVAGVTIGICYAWRIGLVGMACIPLTILAGFIRLKVVENKDGKTSLVHYEAAQKACEAASAIRTVTALSCARVFSAQYSKSLDEPVRLAKRSAFYSTALFGLSQALMFWVLALVFWYGSRQVVLAGVSSGDFFVALTAVIFGSIEAGQMFSYAPDISGAKSAGNAIIRSLEGKASIGATASNARELGELEGALSLSNVSFHYPARPHIPVLRGLSLDVKAGQFVALVGSSGSGKSTIIQLIERFYDSASGTIHIDGQDVRNTKLASLRSSLALVAQEPALFSGTVRSNVIMGALSEPTQEDVERACRSANIHDFIVSLPQGYDTEVGGKGSQLSGGQKQRIAIARALIREPKILLLDEATSALDSQSEQVVQEALDAAAVGRTTIAIAHRLSSIQRADVICVLKNGVIAEKGTHQELLQQKGLYYALVADETHA